MSSYIGVRCPVCNKKFVQSDDIVVCPVCGAPHHRACYAKNSACAFADDHLSGKEWRPPAPEPAQQAENIPPHVAMCPSCKSQNPQEVIFCQVCGKRMSGTIPPQGSMWGYPGMQMQMDPVSMMYGGISPDDTIEGESVRDLAMYIGDNSAYYLPRFKNMDENSRTLSFNFSALIFNFLYFFHRKMYLIGAVLLALYVIGAIPSFLYARETFPEIMYRWGMGPRAAANQSAAAHYQSLVNVTSTINFFISIIISFCANRFYYAKAISGVKKIRETKIDPPDERAYAQTLSQKGGVSKAAVIIVISVIVIAYFVSAGILSYSYMLSGGYLIQ